MAPSKNKLSDGVKYSENLTDLSTVSSESSASSPLKYTAVGDIGPAVDKLRTAFHSTQKTHSLQFRLNQLRNLYFALKDNEDVLTEALFKDFNRVPNESRNLEIVPALSELVHTMANLHKWAKPEQVEGMPLSMAGTPAYIEKIPLGVVLIISPFNYPLLLSFSAVVGALAAGNSVVLKQSEQTPYFTQVFSDLLSKALDPDVFVAINGAIPETTELLEQKFDKIMYTGNNTVGKIIAKKAAETLTPVVLELGGKSPAFVLEDLDDSEISTVANRVAWGKFTNCGQTCVAVDYVLVHESKKQKLLQSLKKVTETKFFPGIDENDPNYTHLIHDRAFDTISKTIDTTKGKFLTGEGGKKKRDAKSRFIPPTIIYDVDFSDSTMKQENFGPILPIISYTNLNDAISKVTGLHDTPLAQYIFTSNPSKKTNKQVDSILKSVRSGGVMLNDVILHVGLSNAPFGGIGQSGHGAYHGEYSFQTFSHLRTTMEIALWKEKVLASRYPPFSDKKARLIKTSMTDYNGNVWFGRSGDVKINGPNPVWSFYTGFAGVLALGYYFLSS
ncbi:fatty aldehyde dehydrogenase Hfd1p [[Candida] railenensis]|uniref:Aldehyde dehydrogenase n=1 Tax=[Candida] railenensis TaxID=45579 RepID=A0A9P0QNA5_9ASCO|nr:fatty aldehyde dehydrogenase Hfd1p [[Candida] railenensis]